jgi:hypothetical protein
MLRVMGTVFFVFPFMGVGAAVVSGADEPYCEVYCPGHFGNWYEVAGENEMRWVLAEAKFWGFNRYGDWFDMMNCSDPLPGDIHYDLSNALWDRKKAHYRNAQSLGLATDLILTPNHVYYDRLKPEWLAKSSGRVFGQLICPSVPEARGAILKDYDGLLGDLARSGVRLNALNACPYDYGGCECDHCKPWIITFAKLTVDIYKIAQQHHPGIELHFIGWWWSAEEHKLFAEWMDKNAPNTAVSMALHMPYGATGVADVPLPKNCKRHAFVHIGYAEEADARDTYGKTGPVIATDRLEKSVRDLKATGVAGVTAYSEGVFDDVNKALLAGMFTGKFKDSREVLLAYAKRYFAADDAQANAWADWLTGWGKPFARDAASARKAFDGLSGKAMDWRRRQWDLKADMFAANQAIGPGTEWTPERLAKVDQFWAAEETLQREVYGTGPLRAIFGRKFIGLPWHKSWMDHQTAQYGKSTK